MTELFEGRVSDVQAAAFIVALRTKGETEDELVALVGRDASLRNAGEGRRRCDRHLRYRRRPLRHRERLDDGRAHRGGRGRASREARQPRRVVAGGIGRRARGARRRDRARSRAASRKCVEEAGMGFCFARRYHPGDALSRSGPRRDRGAHHLQLPRPARQPGACPPPGRRRLRSGDGQAHARHAARARHRTGDGVLRRRRPRRAHHHDDEHGARAHRRSAARVHDGSRRLRHRARRAPTVGGRRRGDERPGASATCSRESRGRAAISRSSTPPPQSWSRGSPTTSAPASKSPRNRSTAVPPNARSKRSSV